MEIIKVLIVEDELIIAAHIEQILEDAGFEVAEILTKGEEVPSFLSKNPVDILLMDINLAGKLDGVETVNIVNDLFDIPVIFLTSNNDDHSFNRAKETLPHAFLAKPFDDQELIRCFDLVSLHLLQHKTSDNANSSDEKKSVLDKYIFVREKDRMVKVNIAEILIVEAERNYSRIITSDKEFLLSVPMKTVEEKVCSKYFLRVHRSYLANLLQVEGFNQDYLFYKNRHVPISKTYKEDVISRLKVI